MRPTSLAFLGRPPSGLLHRLWTSYSSVIPTIAWAGPGGPVVPPSCRGRRIWCVGAAQRLRGRCRATRHGGPRGSDRWRISSSWARAATCWAISVAWIPWNRPSSHPTSWAWAIRSSASEGSPVSKGWRSDPVRPPGRGEALGQFADRLLVDLPQPAPAGLVQRRQAHLLQQLLDHRSDAEQLGRLLDGFGGSLVRFLAGGRRERAIGSGAGPAVPPPLLSSTISGCSGTSSAESGIWSAMIRCCHLLRGPPRGPGARHGSMIRDGCGAGSPRCRRDL